MKKQLDNQDSLRACEAENKDLQQALKLMEHKVITCGVAATNPDPHLTLREDYMRWNSPQAEAVRSLRAKLAEAERDAARWRAIEPHLFVYMKHGRTWMDLYPIHRAGVANVDQIVDRLVAEKEASDG